MIYKDKVENLIKEKLSQIFNKLSYDTYKDLLKLKDQKDEFLDEAITRMVEQPDNIDRTNIVKSILKEKFPERKVVDMDLTDLFFELLIEMIKLDKEERLKEVRDSIFEETCYKCYD